MVSISRIADRVGSSLTAMPGFWINAFSIIAAYYLVSGRYDKEALEIADRANATGISVRGALERRPSGPDAVQAAAHQLERQLILSLMGRRSSDFALGAPQAADTAEAEVRHFVRDLDLAKVLGAASVRGSILGIADGVAASASDWLSSRSVFAQNLSVYRLWLMIAASYAIAVWLLYASRAVSPETAEPLFNVIDVGMYLTLTEYSGGLQSPAGPVLVLSVLVVLLEIRAVYKRHERVAAVALGVADSFLALVKRYFASGLYFFALFVGLVWAAVDSERGPGTALGVIIVHTFVAFGTVLMVGLIVFLILIALGTYFHGRPEASMTQSIRRTHGT